MDSRLEIAEVFRVGGYGLILYFSDKTSAKYTVDELAKLRPSREPAERVPVKA